MGSSSQTPGVVVWEWQKWPNVWFPYDLKVIHFLERNHLTLKPGCSSNAVVNLGEVDPHLACYDVDLASMTQTRVETGTTRDIRRTTYPLNSLPGQGIRWEWRSDERWLSYDITTSEYLEDAYKSKAVGLDLNFTPLAIPNAVDFGVMLQFNKHTQFQRPVQRLTSQQYPACLSVIKMKSSSCASHSSLDNTKKLNGLSGVTVSTSNPKETACKGKKTKKRTREQLNDIGGATANDPLSEFCSNLDSVPDEDCAICFEKLHNSSSFSNHPELDEDAGAASPIVKELNKCKHVFHASCLKAMYGSGPKDGSLQCPSCKAIHGVKHGIQPKDGTMDFYCTQQNLPGHPDCGMITIIYDFAGGGQGPEHPNPGKRYTARGFPRTCYLPDNEKGRKVLKLLRKAWERRLIFTVGLSSTTGEQDTVVWNEIHHKTEPFSNYSGHGYPDDNYLDNVLAELASQGVIDDVVIDQQPS